MSEPERTISITEHPEVPWLSLAFGYGPMLLLATGAIASWILKGALRDEVVLLTCIWGTAILGFLSGVRRGLSFRTEGGEALAQLATMLLLFILALASMVAIAHGWMAAAITCLLLGFGAVLVLDPIAARHGQAPLFFIKLRPPQMALAVTSLGVLLVEVLSH